MCFYCLVFDLLCFNGLPLIVLVGELTKLVIDLSYEKPARFSFGVDGILLWTFVLIDFF